MKFRLTVIALLLVLCIPACGKKNGVRPSISSSSDLERLISDVGEVQESPTHPDMVDSVHVTENRSGETWHCRQYSYDIARATEDYPAFNPNAELIWPGSLLQGASISSPTPDRIVVPRGRGVIVIDNLTGSSLPACEVDEATYSNVAVCANNIIAAQPPGTFPARFVINHGLVRHTSELALNMKANASFFSFFNASASFAFNDRDDQTRFIVKLTQSFYTLSFQRPSRISEFFPAGLSVDELDPFVGPGNPPVYISSVTYGRLFYLLIQSREDARTVESAVAASFRLGGFSGSAKHVSELAGLTVKCVAYGGDANATLAAVTGGIGPLNSLMQELGRAGDVRTGVPLSYNVRSVRSDRVVRNSLATQYDLKQCTLYSGPPMATWYITSDAQNTRRNWLGERVTRLKDLSGANNDAVYDFDIASDSYALYGQANWPPAYERDVFGGQSGVSFRAIPWAVVGRGPASFYYVAGQPFIGTDYTIVAVLSWQPAAQLNGKCYFLAGLDNVDGGGVFIGFGPNDVYMSHGGREVSAQASRATQVYAFRYSQGEGMSIVIDGVERARDMSLTRGVESFRGAILGNLGPKCDAECNESEANRLYLGELRFFRSALSPQSLNEQVSDLRRRFGL